MFTPKDTTLYITNQFVDIVQNAKNQFLDTFVWDEKLKETMKKFVESQREYTKQVNRSIFEIAEQSAVSAKGAFEKVKKVS